MLAKIILWFNMRTGFRFWYEVELGYFLKIDATDQEMSVSPFRTNIRQVGLVSKKTILNRREIKKVFSDWIPLMQKQYRRNGIFQIKVITYLGWFKKGGE